MYTTYITYYISYFLMHGRYHSMVPVPYLYMQKQSTILDNVILIEHIYLLSEGTACIFPCIEKLKAVNVNWWAFQFFERAVDIRAWESMNSQKTSKEVRIPIPIQPFQRIYIKSVTYGLYVRTWVSFSELTYWKYWFNRWQK